MLEKPYPQCLLQVPDGNGGMEQRAAKSKLRMQGCLDIDFSYWDAADIARRWDVLEEQANGEPCLLDYLPYNDA